MMYELKKSFVTITGLLLLLGAIAFAKPNGGAGQNPGSAAVTKPSPTPVDVNVVNAPSVVLPSGTTVGIGSFANTVKVDTTNPLPVSDVDNPARRPFTFSQNKFWVGLSQSISVFTPVVPAGMRLVVEQVSVQALLPPSTSQKLLAHVETFSAPTSTGFYLIGTDAQSAGFRDQFVASALMKGYADSGSSVSVEVIRNDPSGRDGDSAEVELSGYLVSVP